MVLLHLGGLRVKDAVRNEALVDTRLTVGHDKEIPGRPLADGLDALGSIFGENGVKENQPFTGSLKPATPRPSALSFATR